jgi:hypothetical protein
MNEATLTKTEKQKTSTPERNSSIEMKERHVPFSPVEEIMHLQNTLGNHGIANILQPKLKINQPGDKYEQEADRIADMVMRMPEPQLRNKEQKKEKPLASKITPLVQRSENNNTTPEVTPQIAATVSSLKGGGQPLPEKTRRFFELRFGADFSDVRLHTDSTVAGLANSINAKAFTIGKNIVFGSGQYIPGTYSSSNIIAHELSHVIQQSRMVHNQNQQNIIYRKSSSDKDEKEAITEAREIFHSEERLKQTALYLLKNNIQQFSEFAIDLDSYLESVLPRLQYVYSKILLWMYSLLKTRESNAKRAKDGALIYEKSNQISRATSLRLWTPARPRKVEDIPPFNSVDNIREWELTIIEHEVFSNIPTGQRGNLLHRRKYPNYGKVSQTGSLKRHKEYDPKVGGGPGMAVPIKIVIPTNTKIRTNYRRVMQAVIETLDPTVKSRDLTDELVDITGPQIVLFSKEQEEEWKAELNKDPLNIAGNVETTIRVDTKILLWLKSKGVNVPFHFLRGYTQVKSNDPTLNKLQKELIQGLFRYDMDDMQDASAKELQKIYLQLQESQNDSNGPILITLGTRTYRFEQKHAAMLNAEFARVLKTRIDKAENMAKYALKDYDTFKGGGWTGAVVRHFSSKSDPGDDLKDAILWANRNIASARGEYKRGNLENTIRFLGAAEHHSRGADAVVASYIEGLKTTGETVVNTLETVKSTATGILSTAGGGWGLVLAASVEVAGGISTEKHDLEMDWQNLAVSQGIGLASSKIANVFGKTYLKALSEKIGHDAAQIAGGIIEEELQAYIQSTMQATYDSFRKKGKFPTPDEYWQALKSSLLNVEDHLLNRLYGKVGAMSTGGGSGRRVPPKSTARVIKAATEKSAKSQTTVPKQPDVPVRPPAKQPETSGKTTTPKPKARSPKPSRRGGQQNLPKSDAGLTIKVSSQTKHDGPSKTSSRSKVPAPEPIIKRRSLQQKKERSKPKHPGEQAEEAAIREYVKSKKHPIYGDEFSKPLDEFTVHEKVRVGSKDVGGGNKLEEIKVLLDKKSQQRKQAGETPITINEAIIRKKVIDFLKDEGNKDLMTEFTKAEKFLEEGKVPEYEAMDYTFTSKERMKEDIKRIKEGRLLGVMRPDVVDFRIDAKEVVITDITLRPNDPYHNFKTLVYKRVMEKMLPGFTVRAVELKPGKRKRNRGRWEQDQSVEVPKVREEDEM